MLIFHRTFNYKKIWNAPLDAVMCPLQIINDIESLSLSLHGVNAHFINHPSNNKKYSIGHKSETGWANKKNLDKVTYFYTFLQIYGSRFKMSIPTEIC